MNSPTLAQRKLVTALFNGASGARAWQAAGYSTRHHFNVDTLLSSPIVRFMIQMHLDNGDKLRGKLHQKVLDGLLIHSFKELA